MAEPLLPAKVNNTDIVLLADSGATYSTVGLSLPASLLTSRTIPLTGFSGQSQCLPFTKPLPTEVAGYNFDHSYIHSPKTPVNLMGRDILLKTRATILCGSVGITVRFPNGTEFSCNHQVIGDDSGQWLVQTETPAEHADIYWCGILPEETHGGGVLSVFMLWKPWILAIRDYNPPIDPLHCTLYYDREGDEVYAEEFRQIEGLTWQLNTEKIYVAPEGVAAVCNLTPNQLPWYKMAPKAIPHISLALSPGHEARELGPMVQRLQQVTDWKQTEMPQIMYSVDADSYCISIGYTDDRATLEHHVISRDHGRELTDHTRTQEMLAEVPASVWSTSAFDVGHCRDVPPIQIQLATETPVYRPQYPWPAAADQGMEDTISGLWDSGVLELSVSPYNTPLRPVPKANGVDWRMAHDLRPINDVTVTPVLPVPDPHRCLTMLGPDLKWFSVVDLANAFFCLPLHPDTRPFFAFRYKGCKLQYTRLPQGFKNSPGIFNQTLLQLLSSLVLPSGSKIIQYVDDLLMAATIDDIGLKAIIQRFCNTKSVVSTIPKVKVLLSA